MIEIWFGWFWCEKAHRAQGKDRSQNNNLSDFVKCRNLLVEFIFVGSTPILDTWDMLMLHILQVLALSLANTHKLTHRGFEIGNCVLLRRLKFHPFWWNCVKSFKTGIETANHLIKCLKHEKYCNGHDRHSTKDRLNSEDPYDPDVWRLGSSLSGKLHWLCKNKHGFYH